MESSKAFESEQNTSSRDHRISDCHICIIVVKPEVEEQTVRQTTQTAPKRPNAARTNSATAKCKHIVNFFLDVEWVSKNAEIKCSARVGIGV